MSLILNLIAERLRQLWQPYPQRPSLRPVYYTSQKPTQKTYHKERYDFSDGRFALQTLTEQVAEGEVKPAPKPLGYEYDFGSWSPSEAMRSIQQGFPNPRLSGPVELSRETYDFSASSRRPNLSEFPPQIAYEESKFDFGEGASRRKAPIYLEPHMLPQAKSEFDFGIYDVRQVPINTPRESFEEMMRGTAPKPAPTPTIKDQGKFEMKREKYWFIEG